jgi:hypothetical protein
MGQLGFNLLVTVFAYVLVPVIVVISQKKYELKTLKKINTINCIVVWLLFRIVEIELGNDPSSGAAVFLWGAVGYWLLKKKCLKVSTPPPSTPPATKEPQVRICVSSTDDEVCSHRRGSTYGSDIALQRDEKQSAAVQQKTRPAECTDVKRKQSNNSQSLTKYRLIIGISAVIIIACIVLAFALGGTNSPNNDNKASCITYESYYVGVRSITVSSEAVADRIYKEWKNGDASEESMVELMDYYGAEQGGGQLYIVEPGMWIDEVDEWCFNRARQIGDVAIIENDYGYTICYFSSVIER